MSQAHSEDLLLWDTSTVIKKIKMSLSWRRVDVKEMFRDNKLILNGLYIYCLASDLLV